MYSASHSYKNGVEERDETQNTTGDTNLTPDDSKNFHSAAGELRSTSSESLNYFYPSWGLKVQQFKGQRHFKMRLTSVHPLNYLLMTLFTLLFIVPSPGSCLPVYPAPAQNPLPSLYLPIGAGSSVSDMTPAFELNPLFYSYHTNTGSVNGEFEAPREAPSLRDGDMYPMDQFETMVPYGAANGRKNAKVEYAKELIKRLAGEEIAPQHQNEGVWVPASLMGEEGALSPPAWLTSEGFLVPMSEVYSEDAYLTRSSPVEAKRSGKEEQKKGFKDRMKMITK